LLFLSPTAFALDKDDEAALADTQKLLSDQQALDAFAKDNKDAQNALGQVDQLTGGNQAQKAEVNAIASSAFADMIKAENGDNAAVLLKLQQGLKNPAAFLKTLSPENQARLRQLGAEIDKQNARQPAGSLNQGATPIAKPAPNP
jgi:hypothetical protein